MWPIPTKHPKVPCSVPCWKWNSIIKSLGKVDLRCPCQLPLHLGSFLFVFCCGLKLVRFQSRQRSNNREKKKGTLSRFVGSWSPEPKLHHAAQSGGFPYPAMHSALALPLVSGPLHLPDLRSEAKVSAQLTSLCSWALEELGRLVSGQWDLVPYLLCWELVLRDVAKR